MSVILPLNELAEAHFGDYKSCIDVVEHDLEITGVKASIRLHYLKFDGNGRPMVKALAEMLYGNILHYCIASKNRPEMLTGQQAARLIKEARSLFRHPPVSEQDPDGTGEAGELLLYFLAESVLGAPQLVSKMELKTNHKDEVKGSDGIHAKWNEEDNLLDIYFGESKLYKSASSAIAAAIKSIEEFHSVEMYKHEFSMVTKHFKYSREEIKAGIARLIVHGEPGAGARVNHACLIGYDFAGYSGCAGKHGSDLLKYFEGEFLKDGSRLVALLQKRLDKFSNKHLVFEVFFLPFPSVVDFRNAFNAALD